jgi:hypothetical protein
VLLVLWSVPRGRSTAFFRMMTRRGDFTAVHEPFSYLKVFGETDAVGKHFTSVPSLIAAVRAHARTHRVFVKETTGKHFPEALADRQFLGRGAQHTFLIRDPRDSIASYYLIKPDVELLKIGFEFQYEIYSRVAQLTHREPIVIDAGDLVRQPSKTIRAYCEAVGIDFRPEALTWQPADLPEWQPSRCWHRDVAASSGFCDSHRAQQVDVKGHPVLSRYLDYHLPFYEKLYPRRLTG